MWCKLFFFLNQMDINDYDDYDDDDDNYIYIK